MNVNSNPIVIGIDPSFYFDRTKIKSKRIVHYIIEKNEIDSAFTSKPSLIWSDYCFLDYIYRSGPVKSSWENLLTTGGGAGLLAERIVLQHQ